MATYVQGRGREAESCPKTAAFEPLSGRWASGVGSTLAVQIYQEGRAIGYTRENTSTNAMMNTVAPIRYTVLSPRASYTVVGGAPEIYWVRTS